MFNDQSIDHHMGKWNQKSQNEKPNKERMLLPDNIAGPKCPPLSLEWFLQIFDGAWLVRQVSAILTWKHFCIDMFKSSCHTLLEFSMLNRNMRFPKQNRSFTCHSEVTVSKEIKGVWRQISSCSSHNNSRHCAKGLGVIKHVVGYLLQAVWISTSFYSVCLNRLLRLLSLFEERSQDNINGLIIIHISDHKCMSFVTGYVPRCVNLWRSEHLRAEPSEAQRSYKHSMLTIIHTNSYKCYKN